MGERSWSPQLATSPISHKMPRFSSGKDYTLVCIMGGALLENSTFKERHDGQNDCLESGRFSLLYLSGQRRERREEERVRRFRVERVKEGDREEKGMRGGVNGSSPRSRPLSTFEKFHIFSKRKTGKKSEFFGQWMSSERAYKWGIPL